jgi:hypothetical protein
MLTDMTLFKLISSQAPFLFLDLFGKQSSACFSSKLTVYGSHPRCIRARFGWLRQGISPGH